MIILKMEDYLKQIETNNQNIGEETLNQHNELKHIQKVGFSVAIRGWTSKKIPRRIIWKREPMKS